MNIHAQSSVSCVSTCSPIAITPISLGRTRSALSQPDRMDQPGGLPPGVTVDNILSEQAARNPQILSILYEAGYVEAFGQGLDTVVAVLAQEDMTRHIFMTQMRHSSLRYSVVRLRFLGEGIYAQLNDSQRKILAIIRTRTDITPREILALLDDRAKRSIQRDIKGLVEAKLIHPVGEGRALRYRLSDPKSI